MANKTIPAIQTNEGNVGIGVTNPRVLLDLAKANNVGQVLLLGEVGANVRVGFGLHPSNAGMRIFSLNHVSDGSIEFGGISSSDGSTWTRNHRLGLAGGNSFFNEQGGNVGIGTNNPSAKLEVAGSLRVTGVGQIGPAGGYGIALFNDQTNNFIGQLYGRANGIQFTDILGNATVYIASGGNVGIGEQSPVAKLQVTSNLEAAVFKGTATFGSAIQIEASSAGGRLYQIQSTANGAGEGAGRLLLVDKTAAATRLTIKSDGNVGIGTTNPTKKLQVAGSLYWNLNDSNADEHVVAITRNVAAAAGSFTEIGALAASANSIRATIEIFHHNCGTIEYSMFELIANFYTGATTDWVQLPSRTQAHYAGEPNGVVVDARLATTGGAVDLRFRSLGGACAAMAVFARIKANTVLTETTATGTGATVAGLLGFNRYEFPVTNDRFKATVDGLFIKNNGNIGIGTTNPIGKLTVQGNIEVNYNSTTADTFVRRSFLTPHATINRGANIVFGLLDGGSGPVGMTVYNVAAAAGAFNSQFITFNTHEGGVNEGERMRITQLGNVGIGTFTPLSLLAVGEAGSTTAAKGLTFGGDAQANLYRAGEDTIKTDGSLNVAGLIYNANSAYYSSVSKSTTANWGQYTVVLGNASYSSQLVQVSVNGGNLVWAGTFLASCHLSYRPNETWINVKLLECATYNCSNDDVTLLALSNSTTSQFGTPSLVLKTNGAISAGGGTGAANTIAVTVNGPSPNGFVLSSSSWTQPYTYQIATSANTKQIYTTESGNVGIGITNPSSQANYKFLQVNGTNSAVIETMVGGARIGGFDSTASALYVGTIGNFPVIFRTQVDEKMRIAAGGNVGIATNNPTDRLFVGLNSGENIVGNIAYNGISANNKVSFRLSELGTASAEFSLVRDGTQFQAKLQTLNTNPLSFGVNSTTRMLIDNAGNVGISSTSPGAKLDVVGTIRASSNILSHKTASYTTSYPGINSFGADATDSGITYYDTGKLVANTQFRGIVWTGKHYIFTDQANYRAYFYDNNFVQITNAYGYYFVTLPLPSGYGAPHGAAWDGRYLWCVVYTGSASKIVGYDLDTTTQTATIIAESAALPINATYDVEYADGHLYLIYSGTLYIYKWNGSSIDLVSTYVGAAGTISAQAITYDGSYLWATQNGANIYKVGLDGTPLATITTFPPNITGWAWNGSNIVCFDFSNRNIFIINTKRLRIDTQNLALMGGNVGIGSTAPAALLNIRASAPASVGSTTAGTNLLIDSSTNNYITFRNSADNGTYAGLVFLDNNIGGYIAFGNASAAVGSDSMIYGAYQDHIFQNGYVNENLYNRTETLRIKQNGRVGIGTNTPTTLLSVGGAGSTTAASGITLGGDASANLYRDSSASIRTDGGFLAASRIRSLDYIQFNTNLYANAFTNYIDINVGNVAANAWISAIRINPGGYVGIGTTVPSGKLHVNSTVVGETVLRADGTNGTLFSVVDDLSDSLMSVNNSAGLPVLEVFADDRVVMGQYGSGDLVVRNNKVGIGTTNPAFKLDVSGSFGINAGTNDGNWPFVVVDPNTAGGTNRYALNKIGAMGFNYPNNYAQLQLVGANGAYIDFCNAAVDDLDARIIYYSNDRFDFIYGTTMTVKGNGVGIDTTNPTYKLDVAGTARAERYRGINSLVLNTYATVNPASNVFLYSQGNDRDSWLYLDSVDTTSNWGIYHRQIDTTVSNLPGNSIGFIGGGTNTLQSYISLANGNAYFAGSVGIGTAAPSSLLHVYNSDSRYLTFSSAGVALQRNVLSTNAASPQLTIINTQGSDAGLNRGVGIQLDLGYGGSATTSGTAARGARIAALNETNYDATAANQNAYLAFYTANGGTLTEKVRIQAGGNVGIGTTSPNSLLTVGAAGSTTAANGITFGGDAQANIYRNGEDTLATDGNFNAAGNVNSKNSRTAVYTSVTSGTNGTWYPLFTVGDSTDATIYCNLRTFAHGSVSFIVARGYNLSNTHNITILNCQINPNGGYANVTGVRIKQNGGVEIQLSWSSGPIVDVGVQIIGTNYTPPLVGNLTPTADGTPVIDSVVLTNGMIRTLRDIITEGGSVGIGTTNPTNRLHVVETTPTGSRIQLGSTSTNSLMNAGLVNDFLILTAPFNAAPASTSNNNAKWGIKMGGGSTDAPNALEKSACIYAVSEDSLGYNRSVGLALHTSPFDLPNVERVRINSVGNVGIGLTNPSYKLVVSGGDVSIASANNLKFGTVAVLNTANNANDIYANVRVIRNESTVNQDGMFVNYNSNGTTAAHLRFYANGTSERMRIQANDGHVGIGTVTAVGRLDVYDDTNAGHALFVRNLNTGSNAYTAMVFRRNGGSNGLVMFTNSSARTTDGGASNSTIRTDNGKLLLGSNGTTYHALETDGNVGIGLTNPVAARLHIKGDGSNPVLRVETALLQGAAGGTAGKTFVGWMPIQTGALSPADTVYIPLYK